jgi:hypothetical protein
MGIRSKLADPQIIRPLSRLLAFSLAPLAGVFVLTIDAAPAAAQYAPPPWAYPYYRGDYAAPYRGDYAPPGAPGYEEPSSYEEPHGLTIADIRRRVTHMGLHLVAKPRRKDNIFLAEAEAPGGVGHRLVFDADSGQLIENTALPPHKKRAPSDAPVPPASIGQ